jgi:hypothetical protein
MPAADHWLVDLAIAALEHARRPEHPMLLTLSLSTNDYVGHAFGPHSWEAWDELLRLNQELARLLAALDARLGPEGYSVLLTGDHGVAPLPELVGQARPPWCEGAQVDPFERPCKQGTRLHENDLRAALTSALGRDFKPPPLRALVESVIYLSDEARHLPSAERERLDVRVRETLLANPAIDDVIPLAALAHGCPPALDESIKALVCRATLPGLGDYYVVPKRGSFLFGGELGTSHGTPYRYDRSVPLLVRYGRGGSPGSVFERGLFGSYYASAWYALTGEVLESEYGGVVGRSEP